MTLSRALVPLFERLDDFDDSAAKLQSIVQNEYPQMLTERLSEIRSDQNRIE